MSYAGKLYILAIIVLAAGWALGRAYEKVSDRDPTGSNWWLRAASWVLYGLGFLIGTGGTAAVFDMARNPGQYGGP
jgi:TRAP-type mannitol/chloroaromatic compound transport system permease small subunit